MSQNNPSSPAQGHAVVIGGSLAGMVTARVLSDHFAKVTLVERDPLPDSPDFRKGVPQARHLHGLLKRGADIFYRLFPDLHPSLLAGGATELEFGPDVAWFHFGGWKTRAATGLTGVALSRPFLEQEVRRRVKARPGVEVVEGADVLGYSASPDKRRVQGIVLRRGPGAPEETLAADLVVDASGRGTRGPAWLEAMGCSKVQESELKVNVGYASRFFKRNPGESNGWKVMFVLGSSPESKRQGIISPVEGDRWIVTLAGLVGDHPPSDDAGWYDYAKSLPAPELHECLRRWQPVSDIVTYKFPAHLRRHYEKMTDFPDGLAVLGDAHCSFNPIYAQGITTAALSAELLGTQLAAASSARANGALPPGFSRKFQQAVAKLMNDPWNMSTGEDMRYPEVEGKRPPPLGFLLWYLKRFHQLCTTDAALTHAFYRVMNMMAPPTAIMTPGIFLKVLRGPPAADARKAQPQAAGAKS